MTVYLDENYIVHKENKEGYTQASHTFFDNVPELALDCYRFIPDKDFIQCIDSKREQAITQQYQKSEDYYNQVLYDIAVDIGAIVANGGNE